MCFNRTFASRIEALLRQRGFDECVQVRTFHSWCQDMVRSYQLVDPQDLRGSDYFEAPASLLERAIDSGRVRGGQYKALLIDEAHDFEDAWLRIAARTAARIAARMAAHVTPETQSLLVLHDDPQSIHQARRLKFNLASVGIDARGRFAGASGLTGSAHDAAPG